MFVYNEMINREPAKFRVSYIGAQQSSFVSLPPSLAARLFSTQHDLPLAIAIRIIPAAGLPSGPPVYLAWAGASCEPGSIAVESRVGRMLGIPQGASATVDPLPGAPSATSVTLEPHSADDWEIVELNASHLEEQLLTQAGVATVGSPLAVWLNGQPVTLRVTATTPTSDVVRLVPGTEMYIAPRIRPENNILQSGSKGRPADTTRAVAREPSVQKKTRLRVQWCSSSSGSKDGIFAKLKSAQIAIESPDHEKPAEGPLPVGVHLASMNASTIFRCGFLPGMWVELEATGGDPVPARLVSSAKASIGHIALDDAGCAALGVLQGDQLLVRQLTDMERDYLEVDGVELDAKKRSKSSNAQPSSPDVDDAHGTDLDVRAVDAAAEVSRMKAMRSLPLPSAPTVFMNHEAARRVLQRLLPVLAASPRTLLQTWGCPRPGGLLLEGPSGSGKSSMLRALRDMLETHSETLTHVEIISCREARNAADARGRIAAGLTSAIARLPSLLIIDDIDTLCPSGDETPEGQSSAGRPGNLVHWLCEVFDALTTPSRQWAPPNLYHRRAQGSSSAGRGAWPPIAIIATCKEAAGVAASLREVGRLDTVVTLDSPSVENRERMLTSSLASRGANADVDAIKGIAIRADGFDGGDIEVLVDRAISLAVTRCLTLGNSNADGSRPSTYLDSSLRSLRVISADFEGALIGMTPAALWNSGTKTSVQSGIEGWEDVGGLDIVKEALQEAIELPLRYPDLVSTAPLRLRSGVMLYGPPGCGKTHVVAAAVAAAGVRCITVSGPELLNKYIGASEAAVRDVFRRAAAAAPSVLFFDEFDAIAPQRGHDNTGVSDRVVNQLLTELDGVEGLRGVCVVAATSRPDLIDAALLRPGRLDRLLLCDFPSPTDRLEILKALSRRLRLAEDVDLQGLALETEGLSGADLGSLLAEAQLAAAHEALEASEGKHGGEAQEADAVLNARVKNGQKASNQGGQGQMGLLIAARHLRAARSQARASIGENERARLRTVYKQFSQRGSSVEEPTLLDKGKGKKVTWA